MCGSMADIQSVTAEIRRGKKKIEDRKKKPQSKNIMACPITKGGHNKPIRSPDERHGMRFVRRPGIYH